MRWIVCFLFLAVSTAAFGEIAFEGNPAYRHFETHRLDLMAAFAQDNPIIFEAGAHYGEDTKN